MGLSIETVRKGVNEMDQHKIAAMRFGPRIAKKQHGLFLSQPRADAPLNRVYIDNTQVDCWLLITDTRKRVIKVRPWISVVSDDCTGMILGFALSFRAMNSGDILAALRHAILPKAYTEKWTGKGLTLVWEAMGIPDEIVVDNGLDLQANAFYSACLALGINVTTTPPMEPWRKGRCERIFGTLNTKFIHRQPGTTFGSAANKKANEYDPRSFAALNLDEFLRLLHIWIEEMACSYHKGIQDFPIRRWREGVRQFPIRLPANKAEFDVQLSLRVTRKIGRLGIEYEGLFYADDKLDELKRKLGKNLTVVVHVRPEDIREVNVVDPTTQTAISISCTTQYVDPLPLYWHRQVRKRKRDLSAQQESNEGDFQGTSEKASSTRKAKAEKITDGARARRDGNGFVGVAAMEPQTVALAARQSMESPATAPQSKAASAVVGLKLLQQHSDSTSEK